MVKFVPRNSGIVGNNFRGVSNKLRIYIGLTKKACIKYGNGYSFCISARGNDNKYEEYRYENGGTPYFIFDDTKSSKRDDNGKFIDPDHLIVLFKYRGDGPKEYSVTTAQNDGDDFYNYFKSIENRFPRLGGLEKLFKYTEEDSYESKTYYLEWEYYRKLSRIYDRYGVNYDQQIFNSIEWAEKYINQLIDNKIIPYHYEITHKTNGDGVSGTKLIKIGKISMEELKEALIDDFYDDITGPGNNFIETYEYIKNPSEIPLYFDIEINKIEFNLDCIKEIKNLVDQYKKEKYNFKEKYNINR